MVTRPRQRRTSGTSALFLTLLWTVSLLVGCGADSEETTGEASDQVIVYTSLRPPNQDIYLTDGPETEPRRLTDHRGLDYNATFSPDGRWLVYTSERGGNTDLYALDLEKGGEPIRLTRSPALDDAADVSPDGEKLAFVSTRDGHTDIFVMPFAPGDTTVERGAENLTISQVGAFRPAFSPDGSAIAYARQQRWPIFGRYRFAVTEVMRMDPDGSDHVRLAGGDSTVAGSPAWSPSGQAIYYHSAPIERVRPGRQLAMRIKRVDTRGSQPERVTSTFSRLDRSPTVGPEGRLYFYGGPPTQGRPPDWDRGWIYSATPDGSNLRVAIDSTRISACLTPALGPHGRLACHGPAPPGGSSEPRQRYSSLPRPGSHQTAALPDRRVDLVGMWGPFADFLQGGRVAYTLFSGALLTARLDGTQRQLVHRPKSGPAWATATCRQDNWIAFAVGPPFAPVDTPVDIWKIRPDGTGLTNVTADSTTNDTFPAWSSDCEHVVFRSGRNGNKEIYHMAADGSNLQRLTEHDSTDTMPALSPDDRQVVYATARGGPGFRLRIQNLDGSGGRFVEPSRVGEPGRDVHPYFSPDGEWIVFASSRSGLADEFLLNIAPQPYGDLWAIPTEGGSPIRLTNNKWEDSLARWGTR